MVNSGGWGRPEGRGEKNCWRGVGEEIFQETLTNNMHCLTSIEFLKQSVQQSDEIITDKKEIYTAHGQTNSISDVSM